MNSTHAGSGSGDGAFFDNRSLFSDYYLIERLADHAQWSEGVAGPFQMARDLYDEKRDILDGLNEAQTEEEFIKPLLRDVLGFDFEVQKSTTRHGQLNRPDYILFPNKESKEEAQHLRDKKGAYYARAAAVADAKYWNRPLDRQLKDSRDEFTNANPSFQIVNYLVATGVDWGILTNGKLWRLYYAGARSRIDTYFEVDLARVLESRDARVFRYFYLFFRARAFQRDPHTGQSFLEAVHEGSVNYGVELQKRLKDLIFERIFVHLATGFLKWGADGGQGTVRRANLEAIYQGTLRLLYRLLFLLHAEARDLLPVGDRQGYYRYSLTRIKRDVAGRLDRGDQLSTVSDDMWNDVEGLFRIIDRGDPGLNVPRYNGGLFRRDRASNEFLNTHAIPDAYLAPAIDLLVREPDPETGVKRFIDYKTLNVEQLGSIYEGLLEYHLEIRRHETDHEEVDEADADEPPSKLPVELVADRRERRETGSYYTPHYIVEYIVEHTLGPVLEERSARFRELMEEIEPRRKRLEEVEANLAEDLERADAWASRWKSEKLGLARELDRLEGEAFEALLGVRVCDPAMGSGHFLVYATDWLTEQLIAVLNEYPDNPVLRRIATIRQQIVDELTRQGIAVDAERLKDTNLLKRMVMKRCIYGVDLNPMATELAKLSLWLDSFTVGAPLSFLDHHLKVGNSLVGARVEEVRQALEAEDTGQIHMFGGPFAGLLTAAELMRDVVARTDATFEEVEQSTEKYAAFEEAMLPYKRVLDLWVSRHFGNPQAQEFLRLYGHEALKAVVDEEAELGPKYREAVEKARSLWQKKRFFHWELEFPEVFVDLKRSTWKENPGFDVVMGNPPYGMTTGRHTKNFIRSHYETSEGRDDMYKLFTERAYRVTVLGGRFSYITSNAMLTNRFDAKLRRLLLTSGAWKRLITFGYPVFEDPTVNSAVFIIRKVKAKPGHSFIALATIRNPAGLQETGRPENQEAFLSDEFCLITLIEDDRVAEVVGKLNRQGQRLSDLAHIRQCIKTGDDDKYLKTSPAALNSPWRPVLGGSDVTRYHIHWPHRFLKYGSWLARNWQNPDFFERLKIVVRETSEHITASIDYEQFYLLSTLYSIYFRDDFSGEESLQYLLALINSELAQFFMYHLVFALSSGAFIKARTNHYARLPIRCIEFNTSAGTRVALVEQGLRLYDSYLAGDDPAGILSFVEEQLAHRPERADVVHDLLAFLAEQMIDFHKRRQRVEAALDPFKFLNRGVDFVEFPAAFAQEIKYGERVHPGETSEDSETSRRVFDLSTVHHDIDGLRLVALDDGHWELQVQLKLRDAGANWGAWQYEEDGNSIARVWAPAYRFRLDEKKARYYQHAFGVLDEFANARSFPGGYTRTTAKKLQLAQVPIFDAEADLMPLVSLSDELAAVNDRIARTDTLIDQIVYKLYGLSEEEIAIVEGRA